MFETGEIQTLENILTHKDQRADLQDKLLFKYPTKTLLVFTLNIPGPIKNNVKIEQIFHWGQSIIQEMFRQKKIQPIYVKEINVPSGLDWFVVVPVAPLLLKKLLIAIEEEHPFGRIFDLDVLFAKDGQRKIVSRHLLGYTERPCFICEKPAKICARNQTHKLKEIQDKFECLFYEQVKRGTVK